MTFALTLALSPGATLQIGGGTVGELAQAFADLGGDPGRIREEAQRAVADYMEGSLQPAEVKVFSLNGDLDQAEAVVRRTMNADDSDAVYHPDGTVTADEPQSDAEPEVDNDPWNVPAPDRRPAASSSAPRRTTSGAAAATARRETPRGPAGTGLHRYPPDKFGRVFITGYPDAPECEHGLPAAKMEAVSQKGNPYKAWVCPNGAPGGDYNDNCSKGQDGFRQFTK